MPNGRIEVHGHRGARGLRPENTLPGFAHALELGVDVIELDVGLTADGVVVVNHDQSLSPVTTADTAPVVPGDPLFPYVGRELRDLTLAQIKTVDAGVRRLGPGQDCDPFLLTQLPLPGTRLPTLAEVCDLLQGLEEVDPAVELKTDPGWPDDEVRRFVLAVAEVLDSFGLLSRARLLAFDWRVLAEARIHVPQAARVALVERKTLADGTAWLAGLSAADPAAAAADAGANVLSPEHDLVTSRLVHDAHGRGLRVSVWTVNDPVDMARFIEYGVDAIVTDYPDRLHQVLATYDIPRPQPRTPVRLP
ncbi:glycerophosphoryl diester phosphodiesterase [Thermomonospora curvata DSM 43183]|uniref:Glycerophosphoryl diester phosphodiesterase n=1 Tax=Thermomonospora curvata (strain ATCC 19995 / DSM 43183 / JCM 3096 / KCTC 9072 / NBRC 15933 / NCIMB 10081 / Henssen B9) TaxID=471852 RepID=D1AEI8_THECD|nr:glycerophosphoryl diester phosphodiesterase [Thermomonospora curvata DSM 43183]PKK16212.1 MAG: glycerophosphodiester phosphodiesterase [Thermomonospora sp. CIF 1]